MATENKKEVKYVIVSFIVVSLLILGSILIKFNVIDVMYLIFILTVLIKYIYIKKNE
jgi:hypothetical protein